MPALSSRNDHSLSLLRSRGWLQLALIVFTLNFIIGLVSKSALMFDGCRFFLDLLVNREFNYWDTTRQHAFYFVQAPALLGIHLGIKSWGGLALLYGVGSGCSHLLSFLLCAYLTPKQNAAVLWWPVVCFLVLQLTAFYSPVSESHLGVGTLWPLLLFVLFFPFNCKRRWAWVFIWLTALLAIRVYEFYAFYQVILIPLAWFQLRKMAPSARGGYPRLCFLLLLFVVTGAVASYSLIFSHHGGNTNPLLMLSTFYSPIFFPWFAVLFVAVVVQILPAGWFDSLPLSENVVKIIAGALGVLLCLPLLAGYQEIPLLFIWEARIFNLIVPMGLIATVVAFRSRLLTVPRRVSAKNGWVYCLLVAAPLVNGAIAAKWMADQEEFANALSLATTGVVAIDPPGREPPWVKGVFPMNAPYFSILLQGILSDEIKTVIWSPSRGPYFDPRNPGRLPSLQFYGKSYAPELLKTKK